MPYCDKMLYAIQSEWMTIALKEGKTIIWANYHIVGCDGDIYAVDPQEQPFCPFCGRKL